MAARASSSTSSAKRLPVLVSLALGALVPACSIPSQDDYVAISGAPTTQSSPAGLDARGDSCITQPAVAPALDLPVVRSVQVFCGGWRQPSARVFALRGQGAAEPLAQFVDGGIWRRWIEERASCAGAEQTRLSDGTPAVVLRCTRLQGGWPHLALITHGAEGPVLADGIPSALPVMERLARGIAPSAAAAAAARSDALQLEAVRLQSGPSAPTTSATMSGRCPLARS